jgi:hypothetical protein
MSESRIVAPCASITGIGVRRAFSLFALVVASAFLASLRGPAEARITRIEITNVQSPTFEGTSFGTTGQYEKLVGRVFGEVDPKDPRNAVITDIKLAPANEHGMVEYSGNIMIIRLCVPTT